MEKNCSTCKHSPVDEHCKGCRGEKDGNTHWEPEELDLTRIVFETLTQVQSMPYKTKSENKE